MAILALLLAPALSAAAVRDLFTLTARHEIPRLNEKLCGQVLDFTHNHGSDRRIWSQSLQSKRDLYLYLPPGYDCSTPFPAMLWLHGFGQDEKAFLDLVPIFDIAMRRGLMPPMIIAGPDGSISGDAGLLATGSFYLNSQSGRFEDYIVCDIWKFVETNFRVRPEREAHIAAGGSMGGFGAFHTAFKHPHRFGTIAGVLPPLDVRYVDCHDNYLADYDPNCNSYRDRLMPHRVIGVFYHGLIKVREKRLTVPMIGRRNDRGLSILAGDNPVEMLDSLPVRPGQFRMFVGYAKKDEFNLDAQAEHFLDICQRRGIAVDWAALPDGRHRVDDAKRLFPALAAFLRDAVGPYAPENYAPQCPIGLPTEILLTRPGLLPFRRSGEPLPNVGPLNPPRPNIPLPAGR
jgi:pimeloyl-ACP methyl ester carboxylesterase